jgi:signal transduction histidine kinase
MKTLRIFLIHSAPASKKILEDKVRNSSSTAVRYAVTSADVKSAEEFFMDDSHQIDAIIFGENVPAAAVVNLSKNFRERTVTLPIFVLTNQSEARVPQKYLRAGVDDMVNLAELETPLFSWTFTSTVEQVLLKKKARQYDLMNRKLRSLNQSLADIMHDMNNPLSVIRLALYHLNNSEIPKAKRETFQKLLLDNVEKLDGRMRDLRVIRRQLGAHSSHNPKVFSFLPAQEAPAPS